MAVKGRPGRLRSTWLGWWHCHRQWQRLIRRLEQSGVSRFDPVYPLLLEIGMVPARLGRLLTLATLAVVSAVLFAAILPTEHASSPQEVTVVHTAGGSRLVILNAPHGARWQHCVSTEQVCIELLGNRKGGP